MCKPSYASYKSKDIKIPVFGIPPWRVPSKKGLFGTGFDGTNLRFQKMLTEHLNFSPIVTIAPHRSAQEQVCNFNQRLLYLILTQVLHVVSFFLNFSFSYIFLSVLSGGTTGPNRKDLWSPLRYKRHVRGSYCVIISLRLFVTYELVLNA